MRYLNKPAACDEVALGIKPLALGLEDDPRLPEDESCDKVEVKPFQDDKIMFGWFSKIMGGFF